MATGRLRAVDLVSAFFSQPLRVCEKMPIRGSGNISLRLFKIYFLGVNKTIFCFAETDEKTNFIAAICRSFLCRRAHAAAQKRRSEIHFSRAICPRKVSSQSWCLLPPGVVLKGGGQ